MSNLQLFHFRAPPPFSVSEALRVAKQVAHTHTPDISCLHSAKVFLWTSDKFMRTHQNKPLDKQIYATSA